MIDKERHTEPVLNILQHHPEALHEWRDMFKAYYERVRYKSPVDHHKDVLGKQSYCYTTYRRYWVWDYGTYRVWVHNTGGVSIEVDPSLSVDEVMDILREYHKKVNQ